MEPQTNKPVITKEWLAQRLTVKPHLTIGRALSTIHRYQTQAEQSTSSTRESNGIGFAKPDARIGSIGARQWDTHGGIQKWVVDIWMKPAKDGYPRICKYAAQLQAINQEKKERLQKNPVPNVNVITI